MPPSESILVKVIDVRSGREIAWGGGTTEQLRGRIGEVQHAVTDGVKAVAAGLREVATVEGWEVAEVNASFGIGLLAETGVILTKVSGEATFEISVTYRRTE